MRYRPSGILKLVVIPEGVIGNPIFLSTLESGSPIEAFGEDRTFVVIPEGVIGNPLFFGTLEPGSPIEAFGDDIAERFGDDMAVIVVDDKVGAAFFSFAFSRSTIESKAPAMANVEEANSFRNTSVISER